METLGRWLSSHSVDLLLCQEVFHDTRAGDSQSIGLARALGLESYYGPNKFRQVGHHGNTILTKLKVEAFENHDISTNRLERRGALYLRLRYADAPLHVFNVHLGLNEGQRKKQLKAIGALVQGRCSEGEAVVLAGDFNDWRQRLGSLVVDELGFENAMGMVAPDQSRTWHARRPLFSLDRICVKNLRVAEVGRLDGEPWSELSDHLPLFA